MGGCRERWSFNFGISMLSACQFPMTMSRSGACSDRMMSLLRHSIGRGCYIKFHAEIWLFDFIFLTIKGLNVKNDEIHSRPYLWVHITLSCKSLHWLITDTMSNIMIVGNGNACQPCFHSIWYSFFVSLCVCFYIYIYIYKL